MFTLRCFFSKKVVFASNYEFNGVKEAEREELMSEKMNAVAGVIVDNCVLISTLVVLLVSVSVVILWTRKRQTNAAETVVDEFFMEQAQPRSKKAAVKSKPKKTKAEKVVFGST